MDSTINKIETTKKNRKRNAGFTLIEVIAVTVMLGVLAGMLMPSVEGANTKAKNAKLKSDLTTVDHAIQLYKMENGTCPTGLADLEPDYLAKNKGMKDAVNKDFAYKVTGTTYELSGSDAAGTKVLSDGSTKQTDPAS